MIIFIKVKTKKNEDKIKKIDNFRYEISTKEIPIKGRVNKAIIKILAKHFKVSLLKIKIISGFKSKEKIIEIK